MNLNEKCLLKFLTNPIGSFTQEKDLLANIGKFNEFAFTNISSITNSSKAISK